MTLSPNWHVLCVKYKREIPVAETLQKLGVEVYCPVVEEVREWSDRKKRVQVPLFSTYVFVRLSHEHRRVAFEVPGVVRYLFWSGRPAIVRNSEIEVIKRWLHDDNLERPELISLKPGQEITIEKGIMKDRKALVQRAGKQSVRLILKDMGVVLTAKIKEIVSV